MLYTEILQKHLSSWQYMQKCDTDMLKIEIIEVNNQLIVPDAQVWIEVKEAIVTVNVLREMTEAAE